MKRIMFGWLALLLLAWGCAEKNKNLNPESSPEIAAADLNWHVSFLASDALEGRGSGTDGARLAGDYIAAEFKRFGLKPAGENGSYFQTFEVIAGLHLGTDNSLFVFTGGDTSALQLDEQFVPIGHSDNGAFAGEVVFAGYGIEAEEMSYNDYAGIDVTGKVVLVMRHAPDGDNPHSDFFRHTPLRKKASLAKEKGAAAILFVNGPLDNPDEDKLTRLRYDRTPSRSGLAVLHVSRGVAEQLLAPTGQSLKALQSQINESRKTNSFAIAGVSVFGKVDVQEDRRQARNVIGEIAGHDATLREQYIIAGAHYDHLGLGGDGSLAEDAIGQIHNGADDNASGTAGLLELAQKLAAERNNLRRSALFIAFSGEELGLLGSAAFVKNPTRSMDRAIAMLNMDMIGRMQNNTLILYGIGTSPLWEGVVDSLNAMPDFGFDLKKNKDGLGPSDHASFYQANIPVLALFTGIHEDYHKPSDDADKINYDDKARVVQFAHNVIRSLDAHETQPLFTEVEDQRQGRAASGFRVYLGTIPDYAETDVAGLKISGVRAGGPAEKAGLQGGDVIVKFGPRDINNIYDYTYALQDFKPGDVVDVVVVRGEERLTFKIELQGRD